MTRGRVVASRSPGEGGEGSRVEGGDRRRVASRSPREGGEGARVEGGDRTITLGLFGGSFDPIHMGHILPVRAARRQLGLDEVVYLPTAHPPHKRKPPRAPALARYAMVELALLEEDGLYVSRRELEAGPSYTVATLEWFREQRPGAELVLLLGADSFAELPEWRRWREILELARLAVLARPGWDLAEVRRRLPPADARALASARVELVENPPVELSSTAIRDLLGRGEEPPAGALPPLVVEYLRKYPLYR